MTKFYLLLRAITAQDLPNGDNHSYSRAAPLSEDGSGERELWVWVKVMGLLYEVTFAFEDRNQ